MTFTVISVAGKLTRPIRSVISSLALISRAWPVATGGDAVHQIRELCLQVNDDL